MSVETPGAPPLCQSNYKQSIIVVTYRILKNQLPLTSWPEMDVLNHPSPYTTVEVFALTLGLVILCGDVMTSYCADGMIVTFVSGSMPPFRTILSQGTC